MRRNTEELLAAHVDGVAELSPDERARVEALLARDEAARADRDATRAVIDQLRALPPQGHEPDWSAMARRIDDAVGPTVPRVWWRSWKWMVPIGALAVAAAVTLWLVRPAPEQAPEVAAITHDAGTLAADKPTVQLWLDGEAIEVADGDADRLLDDLFDDNAAPIADDEEGDLLPSTDLGWVDDLDDASLDRVEHWLAHHDGKRG
jgi:anti-sigma factor RsiW